MPRPARAELVAYALCALVVAVIGWRSLAGGDDATASREAVPAVPRAGITTTTSAARPAGGALVHVVGAVHRPGVYALPTGARVQEAIEQAGGATAKADMQGVNLAARVADAQQIVVPRKTPVAAPAATASGAAGAAAPATPVNLNTATAEDLDTLPGVGPATAAKILAFRQTSGGFRSVEDLAQVPGIGPKRLEALRAAVRV